MSAYPAELVRRQLDDPEHARDPWVGDARPPQSRIEVVDADPGWPRRFTVESVRITAALEGLDHMTEHVGSTSVPELPAKPIIDIDVQVPDSDDEAAYVPPLEAIGFRLALREPWWNGHRMLIGPGADVFLHVFPVGAPEPLRHLLFRDWLRTHHDDRDLYAAAKRRLADETAHDPASYNLAKNTAIDDIYSRIFSAPPSSHPALLGHRLSAAAAQSRHLEADENR